MQRHQTRARRNELVFVDFHGTLCEQQFWRNLPQDLRSQIESFLFDERKELVMRWMRGEVSSEYVVDLLSREFSLDRENTWRTFVNECETMCVSVATLQMVQLLRQTHYVLLVTGNADCFSRFTAPALNLASYFDDVINSADCKLMKDDENGILFRTLSAKYGVALSRCSLIDDSPNTTRLFGHLGGRSFLVKGCDQTDRALTELIGRRRRIPEPIWDKSEQNLLAA